MSDYFNVADIFGENVFNDVGISNYVDCKIEIYTNNIKSKQKSVG